MRDWVRRQHWWVTWIGVPWLVLIGVWLPVLDNLWNHHAASKTLLDTGIALGTLAVVATIVYGAGLGFLKLWKVVAMAVLIGAAVLLIWYAWVTLSGPDPNNQNDHAAGAGVVILAVPVLLAVASVLGLGAGIGRATRALSRHR